VTTGASSLIVVNAVSSSRILSILKMEAARSSETSVLTRFTRRHISEYGVLHSRRRENLKSYIEIVLNSIKIAGSFTS
jgi:hypothetical protein